MSQPFWFRRALSLGFAGLTAALFVGLQVDTSAQQPLDSARGKPLDSARGRPVYGGASVDRRRRMGKNEGPP